MPLSLLPSQASYVGNLTFASTTSTASSTNPIPATSLAFGTVPMGATGATSLGVTPLPPARLITNTLPLASTNTGNSVALNDVINTALTVITTTLLSSLQGLLASAGTTGTQLGTPTANIDRIQQTLNPDNDPKIAELINLAAQDPEVAILLNEAADNGVTVRFGETEPNVNGFFQPTGNDSGFIVISDRLRNSPELEALPTLIHELGHAATVRNGNSRFEEGVVEAFAETKAAQLRNAFNVVPGRTFALPDIPALIQERIRLYARLEPDLPERNNILEAFRNLGISFVA